MECVLCKSPRILKFIDGFGEKRVFCRDCGRSLLEMQFMKIGEQRSLQEFRVGPYFRIPMPR